MMGPGLDSKQMKLGFSESKKIPFRMRLPKYVLSQGMAFFVCFFIPQPCKPTKREFPLFRQSCLKKKKTYSFVSSLEEKRSCFHEKASFICVCNSFSRTYAYVFMMLKYDIYMRHLCVLLLVFHILCTNHFRSCFFSLPRANAIR